MAERDAHLQLLVDGSGAVRGLKAMEEALARIADKADAAQDALAKVGSKRISAPRAPAASAAGGAGPAAAARAAGQQAQAQIRVEQQIGSARARLVLNDLRLQQDFASKRISLSRAVAKAEMAAVSETVAFRQRMLDQQARQEAGRRAATANKVVLGDASTSSPQQTMAFQTRMGNQRTAGSKSDNRMDQIRAQAEAENVRRDQSSYDAMRREAEQENRARTEQSKRYTAMRAEADAENVRRDQQSWDRMRREAEAENASRTQLARKYNADYAAAQAENIRRDQQSWDRMRREAEAENSRRTRNSRRYDSMRAQADADNARFDQQKYNAMRAQADEDNRAYNRIIRARGKLAEDLERERQRNMVPATSASFQGPMPETRKQVADRMQSRREATYSAPAFIEQTASKLAKIASPKFDTTLAVKHAENLAEAFKRVGSSVVSVNGLLAGVGIVAIGQDIARAGMAFESLQKGLDVASGSAENGRKEMDRLRSESNRLGIDIQATGREYVNFTAAIQGSSVNADKAKDTFFAVAEAMSVLGRSPEQAARAFKALEQFASKGQIMSEELKGQLAEQLPGAFGIAAKAMGMSAEELGTAMQNGAISAADFFNVFGDAVSGKYNIGGPIDSARASFTRLNNALFEIKATIANGGFLKALAEGANELSAFLKGDLGKETANQLGGMLKGAVDILIGSFKLLAENAELVKGALTAIIALSVLQWFAGVTAAIGQLIVQFGLLSAFLAANPLLALAAGAAAATTALLVYARTTGGATKEQQRHIQALKDLKSAREKLKSLPNDAKEEISAIRQQITAIRDLAKEEQTRAEQKIRKAQELKRYEESMSATGLGGDVGGLGGDSFASMFPRWSGSQGSGQIEQFKKDMQDARREAMEARRALSEGQPGFSGKPTGAGTKGGIVDRPLTANTEKALAEVEQLIEQQQKLASAFEVSAEKALEIKQALEDANTIKQFDGKVTTEGLEQLKAKYAELGEIKDKVAAGPILQEMRQAIVDLDALALAHNRGVDAANAERIAQDARNKIVEAGIGITSQAAAEIRGLAQAHEQAAQAEFLSARRAEADRTITTEQQRSNVLINDQGMSRVANLAINQERGTLQAKGINPDDGRPTKANAVVQATKIAIGQEAVVKTEEEIKRGNDQLTGRISLMTRIADLEKGQSVEKARKAGELRELGEQRETFGSRVEIKDLPKEAQERIRLKGEEAAQQFKIRQGNRTPRAQPQDIYGEKLRELTQSIDQEKALAAAHDQGAAAVEGQTRKQAILNQVHQLSEKLTKKQKETLEGLIGTLYDAKTATAFEGAKMDLKDEIQQIQLMADAELQSAEAANMEAIAQEARAKAIQLGVYGNAAAVASLTELIAKRKEARDAEESNRATRGNRDAITALGEEKEALKLVGVERVRRIGQLQEEQALRARGADPGTAESKRMVESGGDRAVADFTRSQEKQLETGDRSISATNNQIGALSLLGEAYIRRSAELTKEAELIEANGSANDDLSRKLVKQAGDSAVSTDQLNRQNDALRQLADSGLTTTEQMRSLAYDGLGHMEDALVDLITGTKSVKEAFADMAKAVAKDLARMAVRQAITIPLAGMLGLGMPFHTGGIVGRETGGSPRMMSASAFRGAPRYHAGKMPGIGGNEVPAILKRDEGVFTPAQMSSLGPAGGNTVVLSPTINVSQPQGATEEQGQKFGKGIVREMQAMVDERIQHAFRPGGLRNQNGYQ